MKKKVKEYTTYFFNIPTIYLIHVKKIKKSCSDGALTCLDKIIWLQKTSYKYT